MPSKLILTLAILAMTVYPFTTKAQQKYPSILWEIKKTPSSKPSWLFGTYHISDKGVFKLADSIFYALRQCDMVATEVNDNIWQQQDAMLDSMKNAYTLYNSSFRGAWLHEGTLRKTNTIQKLPVFISYQPGAINYFLYRNTTRKDGFEEEAYLDMFLSSAGYKLGKEVAGLENILESEIKGMEGQNDEEAMEKEDNKDLPDGLSPALISDMIFDGYKNNSLDMMDSLNKYMYSSEAYYKKFITARNYDQADSLDYYIRTGRSVFAAVGSAHLPGREGVIEIMRQKGYTVRPVQLKGHDKEQVEAIKKMTAPVRLQPQHIENVIHFRAPGPLYHHFTNSLLRIYSWVDMANGAYYLVSRAYNNSFLFGKTEAAVRDAIDSLLYENVKGDIIAKNKFEYQGWPAIDVTSRLRNKDLEKYRFIVTPYELLKIKAGGKNQYVAQPVVDSFFNSFTLKPEQPANAAAGVLPPAATPAWHEWRSEYFTKFPDKIRFTSFSNNRQTMNGCIKIHIASKEMKPDAHYHKMAAESLTSSFALKKEAAKNINLATLSGGRIQYYDLEAGGRIAVTTEIRHPFLYLVYSASHQAQPDTAWMGGVRFPVVQPALNWPFSDSLKAVSFALPYPFRVNSRWKSVKEKEVEKPDNDKKLNRNTALEFIQQTVYSNAVWDEYSLQDPASMELVMAATIKLDSNFSYPGAPAFWNNFIPAPYNAAADNQPSLSRDNRISGNSGDNRKMPGMNKSGLYLTKVEYDTANRYSQRISFVVADSASEKAVYTVCMLHNNRVYRFQTVVTAPGFTPSPFYTALLATVKPFNNNQPFSVYDKKLEPLANEYLKAAAAVKPDISERLNYIHLNAASLPEVEKAMQLLREKTPANNIMRRKLVDAISEPMMKEPGWPLVSDWLKKVYADTSELLTIRYFALEQVLKAGHEKDAAWVLRNMENNAEFKSLFVKRLLTDYFTALPAKNTVKDKLKLNWLLPPGATSSRQLLPPLRLYDSGMYTAGDMKAAFAEIMRLGNDESTALALRAEGNLFRYPEKAGSKDAEENRFNNNFQFDTDVFDIFYGAFPNDPFFAKSFQKISGGGTPRDKLELLRTLVKQPQPPRAWVDTLLAGLSQEKSMYLDIFKIFQFYKKARTLPEKFRNRENIALSYLKYQSGSYNRKDTLYFQGQVSSPYVKGETWYFFKYRDNGEKNDQVAWLILPDDLQVLLTRKRLKYQFTDEQETPGNTFAALSAKLMRRQYVNSLFSDGDGRFYLEDKDEKSLDAAE